MSFIKLSEELKGSDFYVISQNEFYRGEFGMMTETSFGTLYLFRDEEEAGKYARKYWKDFVEDDPDEAVEILGANNLIQWALGRLAGPGTSKVRSLTEWLDLYLETADEHFEEGPIDITAIGENLVEKAGFRPTIVYWQ